QHTRRRLSLGGASVPAPSQFVGMMLEGVRLDPGVDRVAAVEHAPGAGSDERWPLARFAPALYGALGDPQHIGCAIFIEINGNPCHGSSLVGRRVMRRWD